ncbi:hypothetical protein [Kitasatospora phosalacinea]|uniref:Integral membrane protein n=1 Tax=Kitasatospora phosalacinea TaxID=2065 RepID=A0ABW6GL32_9ACTN
MTAEADRLDQPDRPTPPGGPARPRPARTPQRLLRSERLRWTALALGGYAAVRLTGLAAVVVWGHRLDPGQSALHRLATLWDAQWYQHIVVHGYTDQLDVGGYANGIPYSTLAFFPLYPWLISAVHAVLPLGVAGSALAVAWAGSLAAAWGIFEFGSRLYSRRTGLLLVLLWGSLPGAVVESMAYSEPLFTAFAAWALLALLLRRWLTAGLLSTLACLTRPTGIAVAAAVGVAALLAVVSAVRRRDATGWVRPVAAVAVAPLGFVGYLAWVGHRRGRWDAYFEVQRAWDSHFDFGRSTLASYSRLLFSAQPVWLTEAVTAIVLIGYVVLFAVGVLQRQPPWLLTYGAVLLLVALGDAAYFNSRVRFLLPAFSLLLPAALGLARLRSRAATMLVVVSAAACSAVYGGYLTWVYPDAP